MTARVTGRATFPKICVTTIPQSWFVSSTKGIRLRARADLRCSISIRSESAASQVMLEFMPRSSKTRELDASPFPALISDTEMKPTRSRRKSKTGISQSWIFLRRWPRAVSGALRAAALFCGIAKVRLGLVGAPIVRIETWQQSEFSTAGDRAKKISGKSVNVATTGSRQDGC